MNARTNQSTNHSLTKVSSPSAACFQAALSLLLVKCDCHTIFTAAICAYERPRQPYHAPVPHAHSARIAVYVADSGTPPRQARHDAITDEQRQTPGDKNNWQQTAAGTGTRSTWMN
jgi:hypothetical protein